MTEKPRVLLIGYGPTALFALRSLVKNCRVAGLIRVAPDAKLTRVDPRYPPFVPLPLAGEGGDPRSGEGEGQRTAPSFVPRPDPHPTPAAPPSPAAREREKWQAPRDRSRPSPTRGEGDNRAATCDVQLGTDPVLALAAAARIPSFPARSSNEIAAVLESLRPDVVVISSYDRILQRDLLARGRFMNVHYAPLPRYRGRATVNWMLINGEPTVSISIHFIDGGLDSGNILYQEHVPIGDRDTATSLYDTLNAIQERELGPAVLRAVAGDGGLKQDGRSATYACTRLPSDGEIDWASPTAAIDRLIRALADPFPAAFTFFQGRRLLVRRAIPAPNSPSYEGRVPGRVAGLSRRDGWVDILTGDGVLRLLEVGLAGHPVCAPADLIKSTRATLGLSRQELLDRIETLEARLAALESRMAEGPNEAVPLTSASL